MGSGNGGPKRMKHRVDVSTLSLQCRKTRLEMKRALQRVALNASNICWKLTLWKIGTVKMRSRQERNSSKNMVEDEHKEIQILSERVCHVHGSINVRNCSDVQNTSLIDLLAVKKGHGIMCFDAVAVFGQAPETELIFIEASDEHRTIVGQHVLWQSLKRRKCTLAKLHHWHTVVARFPKIFRTKSEVPDNFPRAILSLLWACMLTTGTWQDLRRRWCKCLHIFKCDRSETFTHHWSRRLVWVCGSYEIHRHRKNVGKRSGQIETSVLAMMQMKYCRSWTSPQSEKQTEPGDDDPCEHPQLYRSAVWTILHMTKRRTDVQATTRWMCKRLKNPNQNHGSNWSKQ